MTATDLSIPAAVSGRRPALVAWLVLRLPILAAAALALKGPLFDLVESRIDIRLVTELVIYTASTPLSRLLLAAAAAAAFWLLASAGRRLLGGIPGYFAALAAAGALALLVLKVTGEGPLRMVLVVVPLVTNWAPASLFGRRGARLLDWLVLAAPGAGFLFARRYADLALDALDGRRAPRLPWLDPALLGALISGLILGALAGKGVTSVEQALRSGPDVRVVAQVRSNGIALDAAGDALFVTGVRRADSLLRFDTSDFTRPPVASGARTGGAQGLAYDPKTDEVLIYVRDAEVVRVLDGATLAQKREIPVPGQSPGDSWIELDPRSGAVILASEADRKEGVPFLVVDRETGAVLDTSDEAPGNILVSPIAPVVYMSYYRGRRGVAAYDMSSRAIVARYDTDSRIDRMGFDTARGRLLAADPMGGRILTLDPVTLEVTGAIDAQFGARVITPTPDGDTALVGSLADGTVALVSLETRRILKSWYLGPWLRSIVVHPTRPVAYVSSNGALYELRYRRE